MVKPHFSDLSGLCPNCRYMLTSPSEEVHVPKPQTYRSLKIYEKNASFRYPFKQIAKCF